MRSRHPVLFRTLYVLAFFALGVLVLEQIDALAATWWVFEEADVVELSATDWTYLRWAPALSVIASVLCAWVFLAGVISETKGAVPEVVAVLGAFGLGGWPFAFWAFIRILDLIPPEVADALTY